MASSLITSDQCRIGRAAIGLSPEALAAAADVPVAAIVALERGVAIEAETARKLAASLERAGVTFFAGPDGVARMRARTLDGIIEAPVALSRRPSAD